MDAAIFQRVRELFHAVCELPPHERAAYLESACADEAVRRDVLALIEMDTDASDGHALLAHAPLGAHLIRSALAATEAPPPPERLGAYRILARLGSGGMGEVFGAEQDRPRRRVALKLMRAGVVSPAVQRRFALEADVLGRLQHENIARIYEAGVDHSAGERPFLAMEFIDGLPLTKHADARQLDRRARVALLAAVCDGVQHAHQRGVIHRDLKPANILVTAEGVPKILDFGIARTLDDEANLTREHHPGMILGTLAYMSPEQVQGDRDAIDTRSDVYSLGVILHELLTGRLPYDTTGLPLAQAARVISEGAPPRIADPGLRGDLETIILKALQRDRARRYGSPADLAADLRRYLAGAPILARADALGYVLSRQLRRHRVVATLGGTSLLVLIGSVIALAISYQRQTTLLHAARAARDAEVQARQAAESESARAGAISNFLQNMLTSLDPAQANGRDVTMQDYLDQAGRQLDSGTLRDRPEVEAALRSTLGKTYQALGLVSAAEHHLDRALALAEQVFGADSRPCAAVLNSLVAIYRGRGDLARAEAGGRRVVDIMRHSPQQGDYAIALGELADVCRAQRKYAEAEALCREQIRIQDTLGGAAPAPVAMAYMKLGQNLEAQQQRAAADTAYAHAVAVAREKLGHQHPVTANALDAHGSLLAESDATRARGLALMEEALAIRQAVLPPKHPEIANGITNLALALADENPARAADLSHEALRIYEAALGENDPRVASALQTLAYAYGALGQDAAAAAAYERALRISRAAYGDKHPRVAGILHSLGVTLMNQGDHAAAEPLMREALAIRAELLGTEDPARLMSQCLLGQILEKLGRYAEAAPLAQGCYETGQRVMPPGMVPPARALWGAVLLGLGRLDEAEPHLLAAYEGYRTAPGISVTRRQALLDDLVQLYEARHQPDEAARWRAMSPETQPVEAP